MGSVDQRYRQRSLPLLPAALGMVNIIVVRLPCNGSFVVPLPGAALYVAVPAMPANRLNYPRATYTNPHPHATPTPTLPAPPPIPPYLYRQHGRYYSAHGAPPTRVLPRIPTLLPPTFTCPPLCSATPQTYRYALRMQLLVAFCGFNIGPDCTAPTHPRYCSSPVGTFMPPIPSFTAHGVYRPHALPRRLPCGACPHPTICPPPTPHTYPTHLPPPCPPALPTPVPFPSPCSCSGQHAYLGGVFLIPHRALHLGHGCPAAFVCLPIVTLHMPFTFYIHCPPETMPLPHLPFNTIWVVAAFHCPRLPPAPRQHSGGRFARWPARPRRCLPAPSRRWPTHRVVVEPCRRWRTRRDFPCLPYSTRPLPAMPPGHYLMQTCWQCRLFGRTVVTGRTPPAFITFTCDACLP